MAQSQHSRFAPASEGARPTGGSDESEAVAEDTDQEADSRASLPPGSQHLAPRNATPQRRTLNRRGGMIGERVVYDSQNTTETKIKPPTVRSTIVSGDFQTVSALLKPIRTQTVPTMMRKRPKKSNICMKISNEVGWCGLRLRKKTRSASAKPPVGWGGPAGQHRRVSWSHSCAAGVYQVDKEDPPEKAMISLVAETM